MSQVYYQRLWENAQTLLNKNLAFDAKIKKKGPYSNEELAKWLIGHLYVNYVLVVNKLDKCYDQMIHPQKREVIGRLLDLTLGRLLELKAEIVKIELDDFNFFDNILIELKLTHNDVEIRVPQYFWKDKEKIKEHRKSLIKKVFEEAELEKFKELYLQNVPEESQKEVWEKYLNAQEQLRIEKEKFEEQQRKILGLNAGARTSLEELEKKLCGVLAVNNVNKEQRTEAILLLQRHERARQGRVLTTSTKRLKSLKRQTEEEKVPPYKANKASIIIQRHWRRYRKKICQKKRNESINIILGISEPKKTQDLAKLKRKELIEKYCRKVRERNQKEYEEALIMAKDKMTTLYFISMEESTVDEIRGWFRWFYEQTNFLPEFPPEKPLVPTGNIMGIPKKLGAGFLEKAFPTPKKKTGEPFPSNPLAMALSGLTPIEGSALVVAGHWLNPQEFLICQNELDKLKKSGKSGNEKGLSKEQMKKLKEQEKKRLLAEAALGFKMRNSNYVAPLIKADRDYRNIWQDLDERKNQEQKYVFNMVKDEKCFELSLEVRKLVDELMRLELEILREALERDKNPKKKSKSKKANQKKEKKKKEKKDPTGDRSLDDLFMELFRNGIIRDYEEAHLHEFLGDRSFAAFEFRQKGIDWPPTTGDVRDLIIQLCILPLGSSRIHQISPLIKSVCLMGTENSGKEYLARIISSETAAVMFDLTPENVVGKYPGKEGLKMLQHLIEKVSRALQPSIIFVDGAQKTFYKKVPKEEKDMDPKRLGGLIQNLVKGIKPEDQILLLGVCSQPWMANRNKLLKVYQKIVLVPEMNYGSYLTLWQALLRPYHSVPRDFDVSCLARASIGFSANAIIETIKRVFTIERIAKSQTNPFGPMEFLVELLKEKPYDDKMKEKCIKFYESTDLPKKKKKKLQQLKEEKEKPKK